MFIHNNQEFICLHCGKKVEKHPTSSRNHCNYCLYSLHVDIDPGDRKNTCGGLMRPVGLEVKNSGMTILFECTVCGEIKRTTMAPDDNERVLLELSSKPIPKSYYNRLEKYI